MRYELPSPMKCLNCGRMKPLEEITLTKVFTPTAEQIDHEKAAVDTRMGEFSTTIAGLRLVNSADYEKIFPKPGEGLRDRIWAIRCSECDENDGGVDYWFSLDRCQNADDALDWILHFDGKSWPPIVMRSFLDVLQRLFHPADSQAS